MDNLKAARALNELLVEESGALLPHLATSSMFVSWADADGADAVKRMAREDQEHARWLAEAVLSLGGSPAPRRPNTASANLHYLELHHLLPTLLQEERRCVDLYRAAAPNLAGVPAAADAIAKILARQERHAATLERLVGQGARA